MYGHKPAAAAPDFTNPRWLSAWRELDCRLPGVQAVFEACADSTLERLSDAQQHGLWGGETF